MSVLAALLTLMLLAAVMAVVSRPLLAARKPEEPGRPERSELEAKREAKYREIRDAELDYRTGKLSREDYENVNGTLRAEAVEILNRLESSGQEAAADTAK
jgi:CRP-like cAMP-binding protein